MFDCERHLKVCDDKSLGFVDAYEQRKSAIAIIRKIGHDLKYT